MSSSSLSFSIAGVVFEFLVSDQWLTIAVEHLLRQHRLSEIPNSSVSPYVVIELVRGDFGEEKKPVCLREPEVKEKHWLWGVPDTVDQWLIESFYYRVLFPVLSRTFAALSIARLHSALLFDDITGVVLLLGDRGAGKSSVTAGWLAAGASIATDDVTLLRQGADELLCYGIHRELHIDPNLRIYLPELKGLGEAQEYLPGTNRLAYDWYTRFPKQSATSLLNPSHIIQSTVNPDKPSSARLLSESELADLVERSLAAESDNLLLPDEFQAFIRHTLGLACGWAITWGADIWEHKGKHLTFLQSQLGTGLTS